ncbi:MAG: DUF4832 domain-containing protein [Clostridiales bacterium]|nr:DUF4832 domain-containing protein [Clostridiales bacterium]
MRTLSFQDTPCLPPERGRFVDLRPYQNDRRILKNPHKGWFWHYVDGGYSSPSYRQGYEKIHADGSLEILDDMADFPGLNHIYIRFNWGDIEPKEGKCNWAVIDRIMDAWGKKGYTFAFRPCSFQGNYFPATPDWVLEAGAKTKPFFIDNMWTKEPVYDDPIYLEKLRNFMMAFGERYGHDPRVEYVDIGTFGHWGEANASIVYPTEAVYKHLQMHLDALPDTYLGFNDDFIMGRIYRELEKGECQEMLDWVKARGMVLRDDSICYAPYIDQGNYHSILSASMYDALYENGPVILELDHQRAYENAKAQDGESAFEGGLRAVAAFERGRATFGGFHGYPRDFLQKYGPLAKYCANRLGYWYFVEGVQLPKWQAGKDAQCTLYITNRGWARSYHKYELKLRLLTVNGGQEIILDCAGADNREWTPKGTPTMENACRQEISLSLQNVPAGEYQLQLGLFDGKHPIQFGVFEEYEQDGWVPVGPVTIEA